MHRREFMGVCTGAALTAAVKGPSAPALPVRAAPEADAVPFSLTVMLWTVYRDLPFAQRLEKVAEAGYHAVELVDEFKNWKKEDFAEARRKKRELGIEIDGTCGVWIPLADAGKRDDFLKSLREVIPTMHELECIVGLVHVADVPGRHHPGTGEINYPNIFRKLAELRYSRYVAMEFLPLGDPVKELRDARELAISSARSPRAARPFDSGRKYESA